MSADLRFDPLTGTSTLHFPDTTRTLSLIERTPPPGRPACFACQSVADAATGTVNPDEPLVAVHGTAIALTNALPLLEPATTPGRLGGSSELVFTATHAYALQDVPVVEVVDVLALAHARAEAMSARHPHVGAFLSCGKEAGASVPHLHAQILGLDAPSPPGLPGRPVAAPADACLVCVDRDGGWAVSEAAWVPHAGSAGAEVRIAGTCADPGTWGTLATTVWAIAGAWDALGLRWAYNLLLHRAPHPWIQLLPRTNFGIGYQSTFGLTPVVGDQSAYAADLVAALSAPTGV